MVEPKCIDFVEFFNWYKETVMEKVEAFRKHVSTCQECQNWLLSQKDGMALSLLTMSDQDAIQRMSKGKGFDGV